MPNSVYHRSHGGGLCGTSCGMVDTGDPHREPSERDCLSHECAGDGDGTRRPAERKNKDSSRTCSQSDL